MQSNIDTLQAEFQRSLEKYEKERVTLSKKENELSQQLLRNQQEQFLNYQQASQGKMAEDNQRIQDKLLKEVNIYIKNYAESKGYDFVLGANTNGSLIYAKDPFDVTDEVLNELNMLYEKE